MEKNRIQELIVKFNTQQLNAVDQKELEALIESGEINIDELGQIGLMEKQIQLMEYPVPSVALDDRFYQMLALEKSSGRRASWWNIFSWSGKPELTPRLAFASVALILGIGIGYFSRQTSVTTSGDPKIEQLSHQLASLKEMMMLSLLEKESATERLKAVSLTQEMKVSDKVTQALLQTLNQDENVNVRLAALDALRPYVKESAVRQELIRSIARQESPLVQVTLADLMAEIQERSSVKELEKILQSERTPADVKKRIKETMKVLI